MARVVLVIDSDSGSLVDVAGSKRENGRYLKFAKRLMSLDKNPNIDYGANGGDTLSISKGGSKGKEIKLLADTVTIPGALKVNGKTMDEIAANQMSQVLERLLGTPEEISIIPGIDEETGGQTYRIALDGAVVGKLTMMYDALDDIYKANYAKKEEVGSIADGLSVHEEDDLEDVKGVLMTILDRLSAMKGESDSSSQSESPEEG